VASALRRHDPTGELLLVGRRGGMEERLVPGAGLPLATLPVRGVDTSRPLSTAAALARLPLNVLAARRLLRRFRPDVVVGAAGYVCVPVVLAASTLRIPVLLLEQNAMPGKAVRLLARRARAVATAFVTTAARLPGARVVHTGNPLRAEVLAALPLALPPREVAEHLLVMGGSQGARRLNDALAGCVRPLLEAYPGLRITHACGARDADWVQSTRAALPAELRERYQVSAYFDDIAARLASSDLVVMRAGGSSLAEVSALGRPMVLVPYPFAGGHQYDNAAPYVDAGAAVLLRDEECSAQRLQREVEALLGDPSRRRALASASAAMGRPDAAERVVALLEEVAA